MELGVVKEKGGQEKRRWICFTFFLVIPRGSPALLLLFLAPLLLSLHLTLVRCGERKGGPEKVE